MKMRYFLGMVVALGLILSMSAAAQGIEKVDIELVDGMSVSYRVMVPDELKEFLIEKGVSAGLMDAFDRTSPEAGDLTRAIEELKGTEPEDEDDISMCCQFNRIIGGSLWSAYNAGYDPVFMDVGTVRYVWTAKELDED